MSNRMMSPRARWMEQAGGLALISVIMAGCVAILDIPETEVKRKDGADTPTTANGAGGTAAASGERHHPEGHAEASAHGPGTYTQKEDCRGCHGEDLLGGTSGVSCDSCHQESWRNDCTYCHGGEIDNSGAPPRDVLATAFDSHAAHLTGSGHPAYACTECHQVPSDVLSAGHLFDTTPGSPELDFGSGLSASARWDGAGCSEAYCHGSGLSPGSWKASQGAPTCNDCHPGPGGSGFGAMSGAHQLHVLDPMPCSDCHSKTVSGSNIIGSDLHVNGKPDFAPTASVTYSSGRCNGTCHGKGHSGLTW